MFYKMIENKCKQWYLSNDCTVKSLINYIEKTGQIRDAQIEAIKTYLFLKVKCECKPLEVLFKEGFFNSIDLDKAEITSSTRSYLLNNPAATALFEYSLLKNDRGEQVSIKLENQIKHNPESINYEEVFHTIFYDISYTDYLFSLPMGAGKTFLMAAFIYLDLYFARNEPTNSSFAHNFIIFAPSGLKSSVIPSLRTIQNFNPTWILQEPAASEVKRLISFEVLDQNKTASKSNKTKNPNVQKIANHQPLHEAFGIVAVTNAEKVILDRIQEKNGQINLFEESDDEKDRQANELRNLIGKIPNMSIFIDEVHHAVSEEIKLRAVVSKWANNQSVNSVIGFSGTPYLDKTEKMKINDDFSIGTREISNIVYYYPLINGIGNFLKRPTVKIAENADSSTIIEKGVRDFLDLYKDKVYDNGLIAKLGIYCGTIPKLEEVVYPLVSKIVDEYGMKSDVILKFHKGNKDYPQPKDSQLEFDTLDKSISKIRIVLLVQIGKEGWDCKSLTGIIISQEGDCPTNMVLQTSCRCLRQVEKNQVETALIYLNKSNAEKLNTQLEQQQHISLKEFEAANNQKTKIQHYDRTEYLGVPKVDFYQFKIKYDTQVVHEANPSLEIADSTKNAKNSSIIIKTTDFTMSEENLRIQIDDSEYGKEIVNFNVWLYQIMKEGFGTPSIQELLKYKEQLETVFEKITYKESGTHYFSSKYNHKIIEENIRKAFYDKRDFLSVEELIPEKVSLLNIANFPKNPIYTDNAEKYYPNQQMVENIVDDDEGNFVISEDISQTIETLRRIGQIEQAEKIKADYSSHPQKNHSFHYLPYRTDSEFEQTFIKEILSFEEIQRFNLEVYYNGDRGMTEFKIKTYKKVGKSWNYIGIYTPDFLIIQRKDNAIYKMIIVETKGEIYAKDETFIDKKYFMQTEFANKNNENYGYKRFDYLYLEDTLSENERIEITHQKICEFFVGEMQCQ